MEATEQQRVRLKLPHFLVTMSPSGMAALTGGVQAVVYAKDIGAISAAAQRCGPQAQSRIERLYNELTRTADIDLLFVRSSEGASVSKLKKAATTFRQEQMKEKQ